MSAPRKNAVAYPAGVRACAWCGYERRFRSRRRYCSPKCAAHGRSISQDDGVQQARALAGSRAAAANRHAAVLAKVDGMTAVDAFRYGYKLGQAAGYNSGRYRATRDARTHVRAA